ncbi:MAG: hypothetical protein JSS27_01970 [Planctomycetes bacterium]|nr:hypothetical protein [Planctomycetota bacterium]
MPRAPGCNCPLSNADWKGFEPTNGVLPATGHVRLAVGRLFRDTTPILSALGSVVAETMTTAVELGDQPPAEAGGAQIANPTPALDGKSATT